MAAQAGGDGRAGIGTRLRAARENKGLTILQAAEKMHVDSRILEALEAEDFAALGAPVYARGHLRHYSELVGEQPAELVELYANATRAAPAQPDLTRISRVPPESEASKLGGPAVLAIMAVTLIGALWWFIESSGSKPQPAEVQGNAPTSTVARPAQSAADAAGPAQVVANTDAAQGNPGTGKPASAAAGRGAKTNTPGAAVKQTPTPTPPVTPGARAVATVAIPTGAPGAAAEPPLARANPAPHPKDAELTLRFSSDSWAEVYDASGQRLFYDVGAASSEHTVKGPAPLRIVLGNAYGVALEYNGRPALIPPGVKPDGSVRFAINAHGRAVPATDGE